MDQAALMMKLRIKIDVWSTKIDEGLRQRNVKLLIDAYLRLPPGRVWQYLKRWRSTMLSAPDDPVPTAGNNHQQEIYGDGPEDVIAKGM